LNKPYKPCPSMTAYIDGTDEIDVSDGLSIETAIKACETYI